MNSTSTFSSAGDLFRVRISAGVNCSTAFICNSQLNVSTDSRRIAGSSLDSDGRLCSSLKQQVSHHNHLLRGRPRSFSSTPAALKKAVEEISVEVPSLASSCSDSLLRNQLSALDDYFNKLKGKPQLKQAVPTASLHAYSNDDASDNKEAVSETDNTVSALSQDDNAIKNDLQTVEIYLERLDKELKKPYGPDGIPKSELESLIKEIAPSFQMAPGQEVMDKESDLEMDDPLSPANSESSIVYVLAAINIAVYLFGLASPVDTAGMGTSTLPHLYGAKVNELLLSGEWWRLVTSMFLHSGFLHVMLSTWALLFFGPQVENVFGPLAFCMTYFLGGLCGNIFSFFFTSTATVGGTGPLFALFSAWVAYLWQNKTVLGEKSADYGIKATTLMGVLVLCLSCLLPTDEWIHVGAILPGILFGSFASPLLEVGVDGKDSNGKNTESKQGFTTIFDTPSVLSLTLGFAVSIFLCFAVYYILAPTVAELQLLDRVPF